MNKKVVLIAIISAILVLIASILIILNLNPNLSPSAQNNLETCNSLVYSSESAVNLVFFSAKSQAEEYSDYLFSVSPYKKDSFNIYYIDSYTPDCELYQQKAILCYSQELIKKASSCPNDYLIVIKDKPSNIRSSSYMNVLSINSNSNKNVLIHELGHGLAFLADEYVPATLPKSSENCQKTCSLFQSCFQGCSKQDYYRSIENGVMKTLSNSNYGNFNSNLILKQLPKTNSITGKAIQETGDCQNQDYYLIQGKYSENKIQISSKTIEQGCLGTNGMGDFSYNLIMQDFSVFSQENFNPELIFTDSEQEGEVLTSDKEFLLKIPIIEQAKSLEIIKETKLAEINLQDIDSRPCKI